MKKIPIENFTSGGDKLRAHLENLETIKNQYKLPLELHEEGIFKYKHGLKYLPQEVISTLKIRFFLTVGRLQVIQLFYLKKNIIHHVSIHLNPFQRIMLIFWKQLS